MYKIEIIILNKELINPENMDSIFQKQKIMKKIENRKFQKKKNQLEEDTSHLLGKHLKKLEFNYSREFVYIEKEIKNYLYYYNDYSNEWYSEELNMMN